MPTLKSITALERALAAKKSEVKKLEDQRAQLLKSVAKLDKQIAKLRGGASDGAFRAGKTRAKNAKFLMEYVVEALTNSKTPMNAAEIVEAVTAMGYVSAAKNLQAVIWSQIYKDKRIGREGRGKFVLVGEKVKKAVGKAKVKARKIKEAVGEAKVKAKRRE